MKKIICCDWDDSCVINCYTQTNNLWLAPENYSYKYNIPLINKLLLYQQEKIHDLYILTFRGPDCVHRSSFYNDKTIEEHLTKIKELFGLEFKGIIYTNGECKLKHLKRFNASMHFDDDQNVIYKIITDGGGIKPIFIKHKEIEIDEYLLPLLEQIEIMEVE